MSGSSGPFLEKRRFGQVAVRGAVLAFLVLGYLLALGPTYERLGSPAFLLGLIPCVTAAFVLGLPGALVVSVLVVLGDRAFAMSTAGPEASRAAGIFAMSIKLLLAGGLGFVVDSRRRIRTLNAQLRHEVRVREQREESIRQSERSHRALVESLGEGVGLFDEDDRVVVANRALAATLQVSLAELVGRRFAEFVVQEGSAESVETEVREGEACSYEVMLEQRESLLLVTETKLEPEGEKAPLTLRVVRDLTERVLSERRQRDLERALQRSQALQSLAVMAGGVAHDFNNLLCGVVGNAQLALRKVPPAAPAVLSNCLNEIISFAGEATQLSKQMLAYAGQRSLAIEAVESNAEISSALRLLHATVESKAQLVLELAPGLPEVAADRFQLRQVITNLVLNALDAMEGKRGALTLRTESVHLEADAAEQHQLHAGNYVKITVADTGRGVAEEARERLFDPFFSTKAAGRGMGLAAASGIVRAHHGWLGVSSTSPQGTSFAILLPVARESTRRHASSATVAVKAPPVAARSILLIDDEPAVRAVTGRLLRELGHQVVTASSGQRGLEIFRKQGQVIDLVVLDLTMPEQSGEEILGELIGLRDDVRVVITSGFHAIDASQLLGVPNVVGFLEKPHTLTNLEMVLASVDTRAVGPSNQVNAPVT